MTNVDQFESTFRSADKRRFEPAPVEIGSVLVITDREEYEARLFADQVERFLGVLGGDDGPRWDLVHGREPRSVRDLLDLVEQRRPDLICVYRHLFTEGWQWPYTLGDHLEVLSQATPTPVLVLPHPEAGRASPHALEGTRLVMAITDHLTGDDRLVNYAARFTDARGRLILAHVEDEAVYERYIETISKIASIDTDVARTEIRRQLLKEPTDYIASCREVLVPTGRPAEIEPIVTLGRRLETYTRLVDEQQVDLLVLNTKDEDQLAMHGLAYPLAVELRQIPLLML